MRGDTTLPLDLRKCRLCLEDKKGLIYIFEVSGSLKNVARAIKEVLLYEVSLDDKFPPFVCTSCSDKLHEFKEFKKKCDSYQETYKFFLKSKEEKTVLKPCCSDVKKEEKPVLFLKKPLLGFPMVQPPEEFKVLQKQEDEVPIDERDLSCIVRVYPINADDDLGVQDTDPLAVPQSMASGDGVACIVPKDDKAVIEGGKEESDEEAVDLPYDGAPFIVSMFPIEADPSVEEAEKNVPEPMDVSLASEDSPVRATVSPHESDGEDDMIAEDLEQQYQNQELPEENPVTTSSQPQEIDAEDVMIVKDPEREDQSQPLPEGEGRKLRPRKPTSYKLDCPSPGLDDLMDSSDYSLSEQEGSNCSSSDYSYSSRRYSRQREKPSIAPMQEDAVGPGRSEGSLTSEAILEMSNHMKDKWLNNMRRHLEEMKKILKQTEGAAEGRLENVGSFLVDNAARFVNLIPSVPVATSLTQPKKAVVTVDVDKGHLPEGAVPSQGGSVAAPVGNNASNEVHVRDYASLPAGTSLIAPKKAVVAADNAKSPRTTAPEQGKRSGSKSTSGATLMEKLLLSNIKNAVIDSAHKMVTRSDDLSEEGFITPDVGQLSRNEVSSDQCNILEYPSACTSEIRLEVDDQDDFIGVESVLGRIFTGFDNILGGNHYLKHGGGAEQVNGMSSTGAAVALEEKSGDLGSVTVNGSRGLKTSQVPVESGSKETAGDVSNVSQSGRKECSNVELPKATQKPSQSGSDTDWWGSDKASETSEFFVDDFEENERPEPQVTNEYLCEICGKVYTRSSSLYVHLKKHKGEYSFACKTCPKTFTSKTRLEIHMLAHADDRCFKCDKCPKAFKSKLHLQQHSISHTGKRKYPCDHCEDSFRTRWQFAAHQKKHEGKVLWSCDCGEKCKSWEELQNHQAEHKKNRTYKCEICSRLYTKKELLARHFMTHTKPFQCSICDKGFSKPRDKVDHEAMHKGERKFECDVCRAKFFRKGTMLKHRREVHIEVQKFKCQFCSFRTKYKFEWRKHENRHRKNELLSS